MRHFYTQYPLAIFLMMATLVMVGMPIKGHGDITGGDINSAVSILDGNWEQGGLLRGKVKPGYGIAFDGRELQTDRQGRFVIGLGRDTGTEVTVTLIAPDGVKQFTEFPVKQRQYKIQKINGVPAKTVNPPKRNLERIQKEAALTRQARAVVSRRSDVWSQFKWPLTGPITGVYGSQRFYNGEPRRPHYGVDVAAPVGTEVNAPASGVVTLAYDDMFFSGGTLIMDHGFGVSSTFIHLSKLLVSVGDEVKQGQPIAEVGATGRATGPHLDWRMNWFNRRIDPQLLVGSMLESVPK